MHTSTLVVLIVVILVNLLRHTCDAQPIQFLRDGPVDNDAFNGAIEVKVPGFGDGGDRHQQQQAVSGRPLYGRGNRCEMPIKKGVCRALIPRWSYNPETKECEEFKFGGCDGNANNFSTYDQCMRTCASE